MVTVRPRSSRAVDAEIWRLAVPAFFALVTEPLFLLADSAIVGHLGTNPLAGLAIAASVLTTLVNLCVFLAYGTTATVARRIGAGDTEGALAVGLDGVWLAAGIGLATCAVAIPAASWLVGLYDARPAVSDQALTYLHIALPGAVPLLVMLSATGILRGLQDTRTPMLVAIAGNLLNAVLNLVLVYGVGPIPALGIAGSAWGSVLAQCASAAVLVAVVLRAARRHGVPLRPRPRGVLAAGGAGVPLLLRTLTLRISLLAMTYGATRLGSPSLAAMQLALTIWTFLAFTLDAIAIAAQAITGRYLGAGDASGTRAVTNRMVGWGVACGVLTGLALAACSGLLGPLFTPADEVRRLLPAVLLVAACAQPVAGVVFVLDGVLIGAGDGKYLAWAGLVVLVVFAPAAWLAVSTGGSLVWLWVAFAVAFMGGRCVVLLHRARGEAWMRLGAEAR